MCKIYLRLMRRNHITSKCKLSTFCICKPSLSASQTHVFPHGFVPLVNRMAATMFCKHLKNAVHFCLLTFSPPRLLPESGKAASGRDSLDNDTETGSMVSQRRERERPRRKHSNDHGQGDMNCTVPLALLHHPSLSFQRQPVPTVPPSHRRREAERLLGEAGGTRRPRVRQLLVLHEQRAGVHVMLRLRGR